MDIPRKEIANCFKKWERCWDVFRRLHVKCLEDPKASLRLVVVLFFLANFELRAAKENRSAKRTDFPLTPLLF